MKRRELAMTALARLVARWDARQALRGAVKGLNRKAFRQVLSHLPRRVRVG